MNNATSVGKTTIGERYQAVISAEARKLAKKITPGRKAIVIPLDAYSVIISVKPESWTLSAYGMDKEAWQNVNVKQYIKDLRKDDVNR